MQRFSPRFDGKNVLWVRPISLRSDDRQHRQVQIPDPLQDTLKCALIRKVPAKVRHNVPVIREAVGMLQISQPARPVSGQPSSNGDMTLDRSTTHRVPPCSRGPDARDCFTIPVRCSCASGPAQRVCPPLAIPDSSTGGTWAISAPSKKGMTARGVERPCSTVGYLASTRLSRVEVFSPWPLPLPAPGSRSGGASVPSASAILNCAIMV